MSYYLSLLLLLPFILIQGKWIRKVTPKLPEAKGERDGVTGEGKPLSVLIIGDSAAAGVGVEHQNDALLGQLVSMLSAHHQVNWKLIAQTGATTYSTIKRLADEPGKQYDYVITSIGVNDVTSALSPAQWLSQQQKLIEVLQQKFQPQQLIISPVPPMGDFPALPQPLRAFLGWKAKAFNRQLANGLQLANNITLFPQQKAEQHHVMASDGFHPGESIYQDWAKKIADVISAQCAQNQNAQ